MINNNFLSKEQTTINLIMKGFEIQKLIFLIFSIELICIFITGKSPLDAIRRVKKIVTLNMKLKDKEQLKKSWVVKS